MPLFLVQQEGKASCKQNTNMKHIIRTGANTKHKYRANESFIIIIFSLFRSASQ